MFKRRLSALPVMLAKSVIAFLVISVSLAFSRYGGFFKSGTASMEIYFLFYPWLFLFIVPAVRATHENEAR